MAHLPPCYDEISKTNNQFCDTLGYPPPPTNQMVCAYYQVIENCSSCQTIIFCIYIYVKPPSEASIWCYCATTHMNLCYRRGVHGGTRRRTWDAPTRWCSCNSHSSRGGDRTRWVHILNLLIKCMGETLYLQAAPNNSFAHIYIFFYINIDKIKPSVCPTRIHNMVPLEHEWVFLQM